MTTPERQVPPNLRGVWVAYYFDWSGLRIFRDELKCLRWAVSHSMEVMFCPFGQDPREVANAAFTPPTLMEDSKP